MDVLDFFHTNYYNSTCTFYPDPAPPSHATRQGVWAVIDEDDELIGVACRPCYEQMTTVGVRP